MMRRLFVITALAAGISIAAAITLATPAGGQSLVRSQRVTFGRAR